MEKELNYLSEKIERLRLTQNDANAETIQNEIELLENILNFITLKILES